jgi:hypothetical protein
MERSEISGRDVALAPSALDLASAGRVRSRTTKQATHELSARLHTAGPLVALAWLNARTRFRFTGLYHAEPPVLRNLYLVDRENPTLNVSGGVCPLDETYCAITCAREAAFATTDARRDPRLVAHPARNSVISYSGVPLRLADGRAWGTLCHFDLRPRLLSRTEADVLDAVAPLFAAWLQELGALA